MKSKVVIGLGFGDEGKGITTDYLCSQNKKSLVVRFSGGHQVGHTVVLNNKRHVFSNFGSGTLRGVPTYWSEYCTINPISFMNELNILLGKGIEPLIYINENCPITTPFDIKANQLSKDTLSHGSTGTGFGATIQREKDNYSLTFGDLFYYTPFTTKFLSIRDNYYKDLDTKLSKFLDDCHSLSQYSQYVKRCTSLPKEFKNYVYEGSQGLLLDPKIGFFPNCTPSTLTPDNIYNINPKVKDLDLFLITRAYQTRHGNGRMTNEELSHNIKSNPLETNITNSYQGEFRRTLLDVSLLEYSLNKNKIIKNCKNKNLVITCLDHIENELRFTYKGEIIYLDSKIDFVKKISNILKIKNVYMSESEESKNIKKLK